jgi:hypothetical protein
MPELDLTSWLSQHPHTVVAFAAGLVVAAFAFLAARRLAVVPGGALAEARAAAAAEAEELASVEAALYGNALERRMAPRRKGHSVAVVLADGDDGDALAGWVEDRSSGGLSVWVETAVPVGAVLKVRSRDRHAADRVPWAEVRVRTCRARPGGYRLGCQFTQIQPWNVLLTFG